MSVETLKKKALQNGLAAYIVGRSYYSQENGCKQNYETSLKWYKYGYMVLKDPRCEYGYAMFLYDDGESEPEGVIEKNNKLANKLFAEAYPKLKKLAQEGDMYSNFILGAYHNYGIGGVKKDFSQALKYIQKSADLGHFGACYDMGKFYLEGRGVEKDKEKAKEYLEKARKGGSVRAKEMLKELR